MRAPAPAGLHDTKSARRTGAIRFACLRAAATAPFTTETSAAMAAAPRYRYRQSASSARTFPPCGRAQTTDCRRRFHELVDPNVDPERNHGRSHRATVPWLLGSGVEPAAQDARDHTSELQ